MKKEINQIVFKSLMQNLGIQPGKTEVEKFDEWMTHRADPYYLSLYNEKKKISDKIKKYLFDKRYK